MINYTQYFYSDQQQSKRRLFCEACKALPLIHMSRGYFSGWAMYNIRLVSAEYKRCLFIKTRLLLRQCSGHVQNTGSRLVGNVRKAVKTASLGVHRDYG